MLRKTRLNLDHMNFLAHLHLADISQTSLSGNFAGDFAKGPITNFAKPLQQGIWLHRQIDKLTDTHELTQELLHLFPANYRRVAPILIDLSFDHMLARCWDEYHHQTLTDFCQKAYKILNNTPSLPPKLTQVLPLIIQQNWLIHYQTREGLNKTITGVSKRLSKPAMLDGAQALVEKLDVEIETTFRTFYPQLMAYSRRWARQTPIEYLSNPIPNS